MLVDSEVMVVRIYLRETEHGKRKTLMQEVLNILHDQQRVQGVVVFRGIAGLGESGEVHASDLLRLNVDLPLVIEFFDKPEVVQAALALLDGLVPVGHILSWRAVQYQGEVPAGRVGS
jgi:PII-like signaling protein